MARIRTIKPEFFTSEDIVELEPIVRLLYISLWCEADKEGRLLWKPKTFKMRYFPADDLDVNAACDALVTRGLVCLYGEGFAYIPSFKSHQHINPRESDSKLPSPSDASTTRQPRDSDGENTRREEGKGREGKDNYSATDVAGDEEQQIYTPAFLTFWDLYPNRVNKGAAFKAFKKIRATEYQAIREGLERKKKSQAWLKDNGKFIPHAATWLNARGWEDEDAKPSAGKPFDVTEWARSKCA